MNGDQHAALIATLEALQQRWEHEAASAAPRGMVTPYLRDCMAGATHAAALILLLQCCEPSFLKAVRVADDQG